MNINFQIQLLLLFFPIVLLAEHSSNDIDKLLFEFFNNIGPEEKAERLINLLDPVGGIKADKFDSYLESYFKSAYHGFEKADENEDGWIDSVEIINVRMKTHKNMLSEYEIDHPEEDIKFGSDEMENEKLVTKIKANAVNKIRATLKGETQMKHFDNIMESLEFMAIVNFFAGANEDGSISKMQFDYLRKYLQFLKLFALSADKNEDGKVDKQELLELLIANKKILKEFWQQKKLPDSKEEEEHEEL